MTFEPYIAIRVFAGCVARIPMPGRKVYEVVRKARAFTEMSGCRTHAVMALNYSIYIEPGDVIPIQAENRGSY